MTILASVTEIEDRVVETIKSLQEPVVSYVRKGVERVEGRFPKVTIPSNLPKPTDVVDSQFDFAKDLLEAQRSFVSELVEAVSPLTQRATAATKTAAAPKPTPTPTAAATPAPKTTAKPAAKTTKKSSTTKS